MQEVRRKEESHVATQAYEAYNMHMLLVKVSGRQ